MYVCARGIVCVHMRVIVRMCVYIHKYILSQRHSLVATRGSTEIERGSHWSSNTHTHTDCFGDTVASLHVGLHRWTCYFQGGQVHDMRCF